MYKIPKRNMLSELAKLSGRVLLILGLLLAMTPRLEAQVRSGAGGLTTTGEGTREYLPQGMIGEAIIEIDPETRQLIVIADEETSEHIQQVINNLDKPKPQVLIKVVFLEVTHNDNLDFGVEGSFQFSQNQGTGDVGTSYGIANALATGGAGGFYQVLAQDFDVTMRALAEEGSLEVLARPSILARNNQEAVITIGSEVPFVTNTQVTNQGQTINTIEYSDIGIILRVTPFITPDGLVEMIVAPEISQITQETVQISDTSVAPVFSKRAAETVIVTPNGKTVVIGGLLQDEKTDTVRKVPILGDIPLLGWAFRRTIKDKKKTELLIFLTPHIVDDPAGLEALTNRETSKMEISKKAFSEKEINKYVEPNVTRTNKVDYDLLDGVYP